MKKLLLIILIPVLSFAQINDSNRKISDIVKINNYTEVQDSISPDHSEMSEMGAVEFSKAMMPGWNLGNTLEALPNETSWGNPLTTQKFIDSVKAAGFNSIRIPVAWSKFTDTTDYTINPTWLNRVEEVVQYAINDSMYVVMNEHWDNGWQIPSYKDSAYVIRRLSLMWKQIAIHFRDFDDHLIFAGTNEIAIPNNWNAPTKENYTVQNRFNQVFVNAVRSTGGRNYYRYLAVQGYRTNIDYTVSYFKIPVDVTPNRLFVEVHYYDPYNFTLNTDDKITQWGKYATIPSKTETWANEPWVDDQFNKMKTHFIDKGYGVILGEYAACIRTKLGSDQLNEEYENFRKYYIQYTTRSIERHGLVPYYWDAGSTANHGSGIFDRKTGAVVYKDIANAIVDTSTVDPVVGINESPLIPTKYCLEQNYPNPFNPSTVITYQISELSKVQLKIYDILGRSVTTLVDKLEQAGEYKIQFAASNYGLSSGIYFYRLTAGNYISTKKMLLMK